MITIDARPRRDRLADDRGYVAVWTVVIGAALMVAGGVVYDAADKANAARRVTLVASEAGRAAAQEVDPDVITGGQAGIDPGPAAAAARDYLAAADVEGEVTVQGTEVTVTTSTHWEPEIMPVLAPDTLTATSTTDLRRVTSGGGP